MSGKETIDSLSLWEWFYVVACLIFYINSSFIVHDSFTFHLLNAMISGDLLVTRFVIVFLLHLVSKHRKNLSSVQTSVSITSRFLNRLVL